MSSDAYRTAFDATLGVLAALVFAGVLVAVGVGLASLAERFWERRQ